MASAIEIEYLRGPQDPGVHDFDLLVGLGPLTLVRIAAMARIERAKRLGSDEVSEFDAEMASLERKPKPRVLEEFTFGKARELVRLLANYHVNTEDDLRESFTRRPQLRRVRGNRAAYLSRLLDESLDIAEEVLETDADEQVTMWNYIRREGSGSQDG